MLPDDRVGPVKACLERVGLTKYAVYDSVYDLMIRAVLWVVVTSKATIRSMYGEHNS